MIDGGMGTGILGRVIPPHDFPLKRWVHIAYQIAVKRKISQFTQKISYNGGNSTGIGSFGSAMGRTDAPLLIGGTKHVTLRNGYSWGHKCGSMKGYIDEVRGSKRFRFGEEPRRKIRPKRRQRANGRTIALWRFEEGPGSHIYQDSSGNGYTLLSGGSLATAFLLPDKLTTT